MANNVFVNHNPASQIPRPQWEQDLPQYERDRLDRRKAEAIQNAAENPAIMDELAEINRKLNHIFAHLMSPSKP